MQILKKAENQMCYLKSCLFGFQGSGKTYTASNIAMGFCREMNINKPVAFIDTETGSDFMIPKFKEAGVDEFIHIRANVYEILVNMMKKLGILA